MELTAGLVWLLVASAFVLFMTPGLAFFYGGMTRAKSALNMMMMSFVAIATVGITWVLWGASMATSNDDNFYQIFANPFSHFGLHNFTDPADLIKVGYAATFAIITVALISGAIADRAKYSTWLVFTVIWATVVYFPVANWVFAFDGYAAQKGGWIANQLKTIDFAGGTAVHINAGAAALVLALILGKRVGFAKDPMRPHNLTLVMLGAALLWFGWFGFNAGSALGANNTAAVTWVNTMAATAAACLGWLATERIRNGHATSLGAASGIVAGLVAITPACSAVTPLGAVAIGLIAGVLCALAISLKYRFGYDDSLDVVGVHLVGGITGTLAIGFFASASAPAGVDGLFYGGGLDQLWRQAVGAGAVLVYSFVLTGLIGLALHKTLGFRVERDAEVSGIDIEEHAETSYDLGSLGSGGLIHAGASMFGSHDTNSTATSPTATTATPNRQGATS
jgi:Amt family ammonium transporter